MFSFLDIKNSCDGAYSSSLDVRFTKACDNRCGFCIEKCGIDSLGATDVDKLIQSTIASKQDTVLILGGEPFLEVVKLNKYVKGIRPYVKEIFITTSIPNTLNISDSNVLEVIELIDGLNVSLQHYDSNINNDVLNATNRFNRLERLESILVDEAIASKVRVSINLCKGYIDSKSEIDKFIDKMVSINCKHIKINELQEVEDDIYVSFEKEYGIKLKSPYVYGCQTDISDKINKGIKITLKRACFKVQPESIAKNNVTFKDLLKLVYRKHKPFENNMCVLYENGELFEGWLQKEE